MKEIWKDINGFEGKYQISNLGRIRSNNYKNSGKTKLLKISKEKSLNENLIKANSSLFQQVGNQGTSALNKEPKEVVEEPKKPKSFSINDCFDKKGNFIK